MAFLKKFRNFHFSLSTKLILSMAGIVILSALASVFISNVVIHNQTRELENKIKVAVAQTQEARRQNAVPPAAILEQVRQIVNSGDISENTLTQIRRIINNNNLDNTAFVKIIQEAGFPTSTAFCPPARSDTVSRPPDASGSGRGDRCQNNPEAMGAFYNYQVGQSIGLGSLLSALIAVAVGFLLSRNIIRPLKMLEVASERIAEGNYDNEIKLTGRDELSRLARSFNQMARTLRQTEQKRKDLVADVSHELRTPLSSIQGYTEVLRDGLVSLPSQQNVIYEHILKEVKHLTAMVSSMRTWVNNEHSLEHLNLDDIPAKYAASMVIDRFRPAAAQKNIELHLEVAQPEPQVRADTDALSHVLSNLVDNALRYTPSGGIITLRISWITLPGEKVRRVQFEVSDTGCGIEPEHLPFLFERFYRVDKSRDRLTGGSGLGLAIVRDTVNALGGSIKIESQPGRGTQVTFDLPQVKPFAPKSKKYQAAIKTG